LVNVRSGAQGQTLPVTATTKEHKYEVMSPVLPTAFSNQSGLRLPESETEESKHSSSLTINSIGQYDPPKLIKFQDYYDYVELIQHRNGEIEPLVVKAMRPFLLPSEVNSKTVGSKIKNLKGKGKGKNSVKNKAVAKTFTIANPIPAANRFSPDNKPYVVVQESELTSIFSTSTSIPVFYATYFTANQIDQFSSLAAVFDQYRIEEIELWMVGNNVVSAENSNGLLCTVVDYDDAVALGTFALMQDYSNAVTSPMGVQHYRRFVPHAAVAMYSGSFTSYGNVEAPWIDCSSGSVQHYGFKAAAQTTSIICGFNLIIRFRIAFRNVR